MRRFILIVLVAALLLCVSCTGSGGDGEGIEEMAFEFFVEISKIPRGSGNEQAVSDWLAEFGSERGLEVYQDATFNVLIKKPGSAGRENEPAIVLQAHIDMVCEKNEGIEHDFLSDPIIPVTDGDWVTAQGTTLGADNGAGVAMILAVLDADGLSHPPIEALFTSDEEAGMSGAAAFDYSRLYGTRLINLDAEEDGIFYVSCAGSVRSDTVIPVEMQALSADLTSYTLSVKGLAGGHSGVDIDKGLANANILLAQLLDEISTIGVQLSTISGGSAPNSIPRESAAVISFAASDFDAVQAVIAQAEETYKSEYPLDTGMTITLEQTETAQSAMTATSAKTVIDAVLQMPNGVITMSSAIEGLVQTSNNLGIVTTDDDAVTLTCMARSSEPSEQEETKASLRELADSIGASFNINSESPAWPYKVESPLRDMAIEIFTEMFGREPSPEAVHAGLECGMFAQQILGIDMLSFGPEIQGAHSPDEKMSVSSFNRMCDFLIKILEQI